MDTPSSQLQTPLYCVRCGCYLGLNDPGVLATAWCEECHEHEAPKHRVAASLMRLKALLRLARG